MDYIDFSRKIENLNKIQSIFEGLPLTFHSIKIEI